MGIDNIGMRRLLIDSEYLEEQNFYYGNGYTEEEIEVASFFRTASMALYKRRVGTYHAIKISGTAVGDFQAFEHINRNAVHTVGGIRQYKERFSAGAMPFDVTLDRNYRIDHDADAGDYRPVVTDDLGNTLTYTMADSDTLTITSGGSILSSYVYVEYYGKYTMAIVETPGAKYNDVASETGWEISFEETG